MHPYLETLLKSIDLEEKSQQDRFRLDQQHSLKNLKTEGLALHPLIITRKSFGYADYPEISFKVNFAPEITLFRDGASIECFLSDEEPVKGILLNFEGKSGEFRLFAPDFPEWLEDDGVAIKLAPDTRTTSLMKKALLAIPENRTQNELFELLHSDNPIATLAPDIDKCFESNRLNPSQQKAASIITGSNQIAIVHGPPGTGKTTTLVEAILKLVRNGKRVVVSAPSNTAVDHISKAIILTGTSLLRVGNVSKVDPVVFSHTPEGKLSGSRQQKEIRELKLRAEEFRRMALKYKRSFGKAEREQRNLLFKEVRAIREELKKLRAYNEDKLFEESSVISGTPIGLLDACGSRRKFDVLVIDEAGQCIEPLAWCIFPLAARIVLAGDHLQLPPTVISDEAANLGLNRSILESAIEKWPFVNLLEVQYRMRASIAGFSSSYFYNNLLRTPEHLQNTGKHIIFIDTAGSGFNEEHGPDGTSLMNEGELRIIEKIIADNDLNLKDTAVISPYSGQVALAKERLPKELRISTVDSFQGQEMKNIIVSLVRSNDQGIIGFLKDYRRMNVAITRAIETLYVIGDTSTISIDPFYRSFVEYVEEHGLYRSVWEFDISNDVI